MRRPTAIAIVAGTLAAALALSGCTPAQSKASACTTLIKAVDEATSTINGALPTFNSDPSGTSTILARTAATFHTGIAKVANPDVKKVADSADDAVRTLASDVKKESADPTSADFSKLAAASSAVSAAFVDIRKTCG